MSILGNIGRDVPQKKERYKFNLEVKECLM